MTLTEFLLARFAEDEVDAHDVHAYDCDTISGFPCDCGQPDKALARCGAYRAVVEWHQNWPVFIEKPSKMVVTDTEPLGENAMGDRVLGMTYQMEREYAWQTQEEYRRKFGDEPPSSPILLILAQPYADHPDFQDEWRT